MSIFPAASNRFEMFSRKLCFTIFSIFSFSTVAPISFFLRSDFIESITSVATSDSINAISSSKRTSSISFSFSSFCPKLFVAEENAFLSFSNIMYAFIALDYDVLESSDSFLAVRVLVVLLFLVVEPKSVVAQPPIL